MTGGPEVPAYRPSRQWAVAYEEWKDDAACDGVDTTLFEIDEPIKRVKQEDQDEIHERIARGLKICATCPVKSSCRLNSTEEDRYWTTRGGQPPEGLFDDADHPTAVRLRARDQRKPRVLKEFCPKGHKNWKQRADGNRRCVDCDRIANRAREAARPKRLKAKCRKGHENWAQRKGNQTGRYCVTCKTDDRRLRRSGT